MCVRERHTLTSSVCRGCLVLASLFEPVQSVKDSYSESKSVTSRAFNGFSKETSKQRLVWRWRHRVWMHEAVFLGLLCFSLWIRPPSSCVRALPCVRPIVFIAAFYLRRTCGLHYFMTLHVYINHLCFYQALSHVCRMEGVGRRGELGDDTERKSQTTTADGEAPPFKLSASVDA